MASRLKDDGIVNKNNENEELLVFGYSCKLFRDDEKALYIDQGKHLIPWMGDDSLKIDRYDARGTLFDLQQAEAPSGGFDHYFGLTDMEKQVEAMCDEERYRALVTNEEEETMYQEEELKRLHYAIGDKGNSYGQVEYKYEGEGNAVEVSEEEKAQDKQEDGTDDEPFVPSPLLDLPINMVLPETVKHNAIIEKTAMFINNQGPQMEILLKMKQADNPQFNFLSFDNPLHNYYRHLLMLIKGGRYKPDLENANKKSDVENDDDDHYLHPSLASSVSKVELAPSIPSINYKPSAHCAYSMLVNKIKDKKSNEGGHLNKLKEALERLKDDSKAEENGADSKCNYSSDYLSSRNITMPPKDMQIIIDKMASYVAKNGRDFETVVQMKNDPRFDFLNSAHTYNAYYQYKIKQYENLEKPSKAADVKIKCETSNPKTKDESSKCKLAPVCFSIKKPKDVEPVIEKSALPVEESSDEEGKEEKKEKEPVEETEKEVKEEIVTIDLAAIEEKEEKNKKILAAERLKDKLTAAAREKFAMATKEKQLQLERKRRAAAFLKSINPDDRKGPIVYGPHLPGSESIDLECGSDVASLPDVDDDLSDHKSHRSKHSEDLKHKSARYTDEKHEKRHRSSSSNVRHKHKEKHRSKSDKVDKLGVDDGKVREINERISEASLSSEEDEKRRDRDRQGRNRSERSRSSRKEEKRHKRKKHKRDEETGRSSSRKHSKLKRERRSRGSDDSRYSKSKRSRRSSTPSSEDLNS